MAFHVAENPGIAAWAGYEPPADVHFDEVFQKDTEWHVGQVVFLVRVDIAKGATGAVPLKLAMRYGVCDDLLTGLGKDRGTLRSTPSLQTSWCRTYK